MNRLPLAVALIAIGSTSLAQDNDQSSLVFRLMEQTRSLKEVTASYRGTTKKGEPFVVRFVYRAPARAKVEMKSGTASTNYWILDGRLVVQSDSGESGVAADVIVNESDRDTAFEQVFNENFPSPRQNAKADLGPGPSFSLRSTSSKDPTKSFDIDLNWTPYREHFLHWFRHCKEWDAAKQDGERLVREVSDGVHESISTANGFIQDITSASGARIELVEFSDTVAESEFLVPKPREGLSDVSHDFAMKMIHGVASMRRARVYERAVAGQGSAREEFRERLTRVFESLYVPWIARSNESRLAESRLAVDKFIDWCREQWRFTDAEQHSRDELETTIRQWRSGLENNNAAGVDQYTRSIDPVSEPGADPQLIAEILDAERAAARTAYERMISAPLIARFDEGVAAVKSGK